MAFQFSFKATTQSEKLLEFMKIPLKEKLVQHLEIISFAVCPPKVLHFCILFPSQLKIFPHPIVRQASFMLGKARCHFFLHSHTNHREGHISWQPITKLQLTSLATEQTIYLVSHKERRLSFILGSIIHHDVPVALPKHEWTIYWDSK